MNNWSFVIGLALLYIAGASAVVERPCCGGLFRITDENKLIEIARKVTLNLKKLSEQENKDFELIHLHSATYQFLAGIIYRSIADIKENGQTFNCAFSLLEVPLENIFEFNVDCGDRKYEYISQEPVTEAPAEPLLIGGFSQLPTDGLED